MISLQSIGGVALRYLRLARRDINFLLAVLYWPLLDILVWGFLGSWIGQTHSAQFHNYETAALLGILLWQVTGRGANHLNTAFNEELWTHNVVNLFSLPLRISEWVAGNVLFCVCMTALSTLVCMLVMFALYDLSAWYTISTFLMFCPPLFLSAIWLGFSCLSIVTTFGRRSTELGYVVSWMLLPFSGAYYPIEVLPAWGQVISSCLPMSYVFEGMRGYVMHQQDPTANLVIGYVLSILYATAAILLFVYCFNRSKRSGLARLAH